MSDGRDSNEEVRLLVRRAQSGDRESFRRLVELYRPRVYRWTLTRTGDVMDAEDATQETLVRLYLNLDRFRGAARFDTWLFSLARSAASDLRRRRARRERSLERLHAAAGFQSAGTGPDPVDRLVASDRLQLVMRFLRDLPERQREVFDLVELQGTPQNEAARMLGLKPATVRVHLLRARQTIRGRLVTAAPGSEREAV